MARLDVYRNPDGGYLLDVQADLLTDLNTCVVVPLMKSRKAPSAAHYLNPIFRVGDDEVVMVTQFMAAVPRNILKEPVANLAAHQIEVIKAIDMLMQGF
jgi:toxin CcdB